MQGEVVNRVEAEVRRRPVSHENVRSFFWSKLWHYWSFGNIVRIRRRLLNVLYRAGKIITQNSRAYPALCLI